MHWIAWFLLVVGVVAVTLGIVLVAHKEIAARELDDVHPDIPCDQSMLDDAIWWWVVPLYGDKPLMSNPEWVEKVKKSGKKIGMHGVRHTYSEFNTDVSKEYIQQGIDAFKDAFGYTPTHFKPPKMQITKNNLELLKSMGFTVHDRWQQFIHKIYHCKDHGRTDRGRMKYELELKEQERVPNL